MAKPLKIIGAVASIAAMIPGPWQLPAMIVATAANIGSALLAKPPQQRASGGVTQMLIMPDAPRPYPMGEGHFAGVLRHRAGYGGTVDGVENPYLFDVVVYSGVGPVQSITPQIDYGAVPGWYTGFLTTDTQLGDMPEATALTGSFGTPTGWGSSYKLSGNAAIAWNMKFDKAGKKFASGFPNTGATGQWVKVYDPRLDSTFPGGAGAHRVDDETTWEWSDNPALHAGTYAYGRYAEGQRVMGIGLPVEGIDFSAVAAWANVCEANDWTIFGVAFEPGDRWANLKDICAAGSGEPVFAGAVLSFRYDAPAVSLDTITEADVCDGMSVTFMQSWRDRLNTVVPKYRSPNHNWEMVAAEAVQEAGYLAEDGEERREEWPFNFVKDVDQAAQLAAYKLVNSREFHPIQLHGMPRLRVYRPGDCLHLELPGLGIDTDAVLVQRRIDPATMTVEMTFVSETDAKHAYALGLTGTAPTAPSLGQSAEDRDETAASGSALPAKEVADEAALVALGGPAGQVVKRLDNGLSYSHNGGTSGTIADWTLIGSTVLSGDLAAIEALAGTGFPARTAADTWALRMLTAPAAGLTITNPAGVAGNPTFALANDLAALEALTGTSTIYYRSAADTWSPVTIGGNLGFAAGTLGSALGTMATQAASSVAITGGTLAGLTALSMSQSAAGSGTTGLIVTRTDSSAAVAHTMRVLVQQDGTGKGRTLIQAGSPTTDSTKGQVDVLNEAGTANIVRFGYLVTGTENTFDFYNAAGSLAARIHGSGASYFNGGNVGIGETVPDYKLDVNGTFGFTPGNSVTPVDNGDVVIEFTNNTTVTIKAKGSDGTVRSGTVTLV